MDPSSRKYQLILNLTHDYRTTKTKNDNNLLSGLRIYY